MKRIAIVILAAFGIVSAADAQSLVVDTDAAVYTLGDTITVTAALDTTGAFGELVIVTVAWDGARASALDATPSFDFGSSSQVIVAGPNVGNSELTSFGGFLTWTGAAQSGCVRFGAGAGNTCIVLNQTTVGSGSNPVDASILVGTLDLQAVDTGALGLVVSVTDAFGATATLGANLAGGVTIVGPPVPGPGPAGLTALAILLGTLGAWKLARSRRSVL